MINNDILYSGDIKRFVSGKKKRANNFKRQREIIDMADNYYGGQYIREKINKYDVNFDLYNGRLDLSLYDEPITLNIEGEQVNLDSNTIVHFNFIAQIARAMNGEQMIRRHQPIIKNNSPLTLNMKRQKYHELLREYITVNVVGPLREQIFQQYAQENGVEDIRQLPPEMQQQLQADIERRTRAKTPEDIVDFMENQYRTPPQMAAQELMNWVDSFCEVKEKRDEGFKMGIITGETIYYVGVRNGDIVIDNVNPKYFTCAGSQHTTRYEQMDWGKYDQWFSINGIFQRHATVLGKKDFRDLEDYLEPIGGWHDGKEGFKPLEAAVAYDLSDPTNPTRKEMGDFNFRTKEGQQKLLNIYQKTINKYGGKYGTDFSNYGIRECHVAWRDKALFKQVKRINQHTGEMESYWMWENYEPQAKDIEVKNVWLDQVWEAKKIGDGDKALYIDIKPTLGQYKSIFDPFEPELPFYGIAYNTHMNNSRNVSQIDMGKPFQKEIDATISGIRFDMSTDIGKVLMMSLSMKPEKWTWQQFMDAIKTGKIVPTNPDQAGGPIDPNMVRAVDMSRLSDIGGKIDYLNQLKQWLVQSMLFNDARVGAIGQYATNNTTQVNQSASYNQTEDAFNKHSKLLERVLNGALSRAKILYKDNPYRKQQIFSELSLAYLETSDDFWFETEGVEVSLASEDVRDVERIKELALTLTQNTMSPTTVVELSLAKSPAEIMDIMRKERRKMDEQSSAAQEAAMAAQQQEADGKHQREIELLQIKQQHESMEKDKDRASQEMRTRIEVTQFERQADVDQNNVADSIERQREVEKTRREDNKEKNALKAKELEIKERDVKAKEKEAKKPASNSKK